MIKILSKIGDAARATRWLLSKKGREYIRDQKTEQRGIKDACCDHVNDPNHKEHH